MKTKSALLDNHFDKIIIGNSYLSLLKGIQYLKQGLSVLIIDDDRFCPGLNLFKNIGEFEKKGLTTIYNSLFPKQDKGIETYFSERNTIFYLDDQMIELSRSPFANIKELARKLPQCFSSEFIDSIIHIEQNDFDEKIASYFESVFDTSLLKSNFRKEKLFVSNDHDIEKFVNNFLVYLNNARPYNRQLLYILQVFLKSSFSSFVSDSVGRYLLFSILGVRYEVKTKELVQHLLFEYKTLGGSFKKALVKQWESYGGKLAQVCLDTYDGVIAGEEFIIFGHIGHELPFRSNNEGEIYKSLILSSEIEHSFLSLYTDKRLVFSHSDKVGTDFPHFECQVDSDGKVKVLYSYADRPGLRAEYYYNKALHDVYLGLEKVFPGLDFKSWSSKSSFAHSLGIWQHKLNNHKKRLQSSGLNQGPLYSKEHLYLDEKSNLFFPISRKVKNLYYEGPFRASEFGGFEYLINLFFNNDKQLMP